MNATADNSYATCPRCKWAGKLRKDGTMRKHRASVDMGQVTMAGGLAQQPDGDICPGSGEKPWEPGLPEGYEVPKQNDHGGFERPEAQEDTKDTGFLVDPHTWLRGRLNKRYVVMELGPNYFAIRDTRTDLDVGTRTSRDEAEAKAAQLNFVR